MKPADFFIGVIDLFAVVLPGGLLAFVLRGFFPLQSELNALSPTGRLMAFLFASYFLGHVVFMLGSRLDKPYDRWRKRNHPKERDKLFEAVKAIRKEHYGELKGGDFSTYKWARTYATLWIPAGRSEIDRFEAHSKFFRSLIVVLVILSIYFILPVAGVRVGYAAVCVVLAVPSYRRYCDQRWKGQEAAYAYALVGHKEVRERGRGDETASAR